MKKITIGFVALALALSGCMVGFMGGHRGGSMVLVPALPVIVELDNDQYYYQSGYYYHYRGDVWVYSSSRQGPWSNLPRNHYPKEVRHRVHIDRGHDNR